MLYEVITLSVAASQNALDRTRSRPSGQAVAQILEEVGELQSEQRGAAPGELGEAPQVLVVSGSNMSGKSTLLRTVGINAVLALAGAPVRASSLRISPVAIGATLRVQDSLLEGRVITSYSIHYTKLYEIASRSARTRKPPKPPARAGSRTRSYRSS